MQDLQRGKLQSFSHHFDEQARDGQVRPVRVGGNMEKDQRSRAPLCRRDKRRAVCEPGPNLSLSRHGGRVCQHLPRNGDVLWYDKPPEWRALLEGSRRLRRRPGHGSAERAPAFAQWRREKRIAPLLKPWPREADQHASLLHERAKPLRHIAREASDIAENDDRRRGLDKVGCGLIKVCCLGLRDLCKRRQRPLEIVGWREKRLSLVRALACDEPDAPPLRPPIEEIHAGRRGLAHNFKPRHLVSKLKGEIQRNLRSLLRAFDIEGNSGQPVASCCNSSHQPRPR